MLFTLGDGLMNATAGREGKSLYELDLRCPPLPQTLLEAMELTQSPEGPELEEVVEVVQHDPAVVARVLRIVNSAYHGQRGQVNNVHRAVVVLGPVSVIGIIMSMGLVEVRAALDEKTTLPFIELVRHSIATGFLTQRLLLQATSGEDGSGAHEHIHEAFTAGILHDFGKLILLYNFPEQAASFYRAPPQSSAALLLEEEKKLFGFDHVETGTYLARRLNFPPSLTTALTLHHSDTELQRCDQPTREIACMVAAANKVAQALGYALNHKTSWEACQQDPVWQHMHETGIIEGESEAIQEALAAAKEELDAFVDAIF